MTAMSDMSHPTNPETGFGVRFEPVPLSDPNEQIAVTMTRARWGAMLDHLNAELEPKLKDGKATNAEIDIVVHLACALISAGASRTEHAIVVHKLGLLTAADISLIKDLREDACELLGLLTAADISLIEDLREDACELLGERGWWADEPRLGRSRQYQELKERIVKADELLDKMKGVHQ